VNAGTFDHILKMLFAVDDSEINTEGRPHTILAAIGVENAASVETALAKLKEEFGLLPTDEIKWNGMKPVPQQKREALSHELLGILQKSIPLVVISEGRQKQTAAKRMATQITDCFAAHPIETGERLDLVFDESILSHESEYADFLRTLAPSSIVSATLGILHSHQSAAIQLADVWAGFNRLLTDMSRPV